MHTFIKASDVAALIGVASDTQFLRIRDQLETFHGFPPPIPTSKRPLKWRRDTVAAWVDTQGTPEPPQASLSTLGHRSNLIDKARTF